MVDKFMEAFDKRETIEREQEKTKAAEEAADGWILVVT